ncbi:hypothetical protein CKO31_16915 [Thiohalocapsa halophila]|uniref:Glycosyltransferase 2-like domain-containing protein n=1 Tax=Thiohalocapsa halophila TaxID=69359 RepID=A0ABS1CKD3_9GAMM|nr:glycosyltransferase [Thiohalocapsa halophila]MBK1632388.1 hypothetical protein [Thiohalocapsa halophila]
MSHQYHRAFDPKGNDSLAKLARLVRPGSEVLDVGAGPGVLAAYLHDERACLVDGIEMDAASAAHGVSVFRSLWVADLEHDDPAALVGQARYDAIVCADILEHLRAPEQLLLRLKPLLKADGVLLLSVPNVAHAGLIAELIQGELRYRDEGLLDRTHIRFFTRSSLRGMLADCGLRSYSFDTVKLTVEQSEFASDRVDALAPELRGALLEADDALTYQFIVSCAPEERSSAGATSCGTVLPNEQPVEVIVPVYAGLAETQLCLKSVLASSAAAAFELVVVDDCGPDASLREWLRELAGEGRITLLENDRNLGFVASVNRGMRLHPERDIVLLNSDTEVANDWLDRLRAAAYGAADIGTVTPFANAGATICAYPLFCRDNLLPEGWTVAALDALMREVNSGAGVDLPTAVGFCTYIRRDCLDAVGIFDEAAFGRGYGEEADFSMRAHYQGWRHRLAADVFIGHCGGVSFGAEKDALVATAQRPLRERHPAYELMVAEHIERDPARALRARVDWQRLARSPRRRLLFISHALGGGVERHLRELAQWLEPKAEVLVLRPDGDGAVSLSWQRGSEAAELAFHRDTDYRRLRDLLKALRIERAHMHHGAGIEDMTGRLLRDLAAPYDVTVHDFRPVCPRINLIDSDGRFCDQPAEGVCTACLARDMDAASRDIRGWRAGQHGWLAGAERVLAPSRDTAQRLTRVWPELDVLVAHHDQLPERVSYPAPAPRRWHPDAPLRVVVLGQLSDAKGRGVLAAAARDAAARGLRLELHLIGHPLGPLPTLEEAPLVVHGAYNEAELPGRLRNLAPHLAWFPARWPETWSYTLTTCMQAGLPVAAPMLGAFPERLASWRWSLLLPPGLDAPDVNDALIHFAERHLSTLEPPPLPSAEPGLIPPFDYRRAYLVPQERPPLVAEGGLDPELLADPSPPQRPFALTQSSGQPLADQLVRLREENYRLHGGIADRDKLISKQLGDAGESWKELVGHRMATAQLQDRLDQERQQAGALRQDLQQQLADTNRRLAEVAAALHARDDEIDTVYHSLSWRLTRPVRGAGRAARASRRNLLSTVQDAWHRVPLSGRLRYRAKSLIFRGLRPLLSGSTPYQAWLEQTRWIEQGKRAAAGPTSAPPEPVVEDLRIAGGPADDPLVTVVIPVHNKLNYTLACLDSIAKALPGVATEVLVVDDCSSDETEAHLADREDIRYRRNAENLGFVGSCNRGGQEARGRYLFFLNNDTLVLPGWLDHLVATFDAHRGVGLVGSKLIYADGRLQEAGGVIWADGSGWNWGRLSDPAAPEFNFVRDVDYCSGAALMIPRALFQELGGFDARYAPAYYEDTDLAFMVRARGLRTLYQPLSQVVHYEGVSAGTDLGSGMKSYQVRNRDIFVDKWRHVLADHGDPELRPPRLSADRRPIARMLLIDDCTPTPDQDSGSVDMLNYLRMLIDFGYRITFIPKTNLLHYGAYTTALQALGVECLFHPYIESVDEVIRERGSELDVVMLVRARTAFDCIDKVRAACPRARIIFNTVDLHFLRERRRAELETGTPTSREAEDMERIERYVMDRADTTIVISSAERDLLVREAPSVRVRVIPLLREIPGRSKGFEERSGLVFVGGFRHPPNVDAVQWLCSEIWPLIRRELPGAELSIIGSHMVPEVEALAGNGVRVLGFVEDIAPVFAKARLSVAPLRYGAGQKGKVVTSLAYGVPCVLTTIAAEGLGLEDASGALIADGPSAFAEAVIRLYHDADLWMRLSDGGLALVDREFSVASNRKRLADLLMELDLPVADRPVDAPLGAPAGSAASTARG